MSTIFAPSFFSLLLFTAAFCRDLKRWRYKIEEEKERNIILLKWIRRVKNLRPYFPLIHLTIIFFYPHTLARNLIYSVISSSWNCFLNTLIIVIMMFSSLMFFSNMIFSIFYPLISWLLSVSLCVVVSISHIISSLVPKMSWYKMFYLCTWDIVIIW